MVDETGQQVWAVVVGCNLHLTGPETPRGGLTLTHMWAHTHTNTPSVGLDVRALCLLKQQEE